MAEGEGGDNDASLDMSNVTGDSFDMTALMNACKDISSNAEVEEKVKKTNLFMKHILSVYDEVIEEGPDGKEKISETFLKKLKKSKKRQPSAKQNHRQAVSKGKSEDYNDRMTHKILKKKRNLKAKSRMSVY